MPFRATGKICLMTKKTYARQSLKTGRKFGQRPPGIHGKPGDLVRIFLAIAAWPGRASMSVASRPRIILTGSNLRQPSDSAPSILNEKTIADFTRVLGEIGIQYRKPQPASEE
jgi:hypothetical protein